MLSQETFDAMLEVLTATGDSLSAAFDAATGLYKILNESCNEDCMVTESDSKPKRSLGCSCVRRVFPRIDLLPYYSSGFL